MSSSIQDTVGWLEKFGDRGVKMWRLRWFVLEARTARLFYFSDRNMQDCRGYIDLLPVSFSFDTTPTSADEGSAVFHLETFSRDYILRGKTPTVMLQWLEACQASRQYVMDRHQHKDTIPHFEDRMCGLTKDITVLPPSDASDVSLLGPDFSSSSNFFQKLFGRPVRSTPHHPQQPKQQQQQQQYRQQVQIDSALQWANTTTERPARKVRFADPRDSEPGSTGDGVVESRGDFGTSQSNARQLWPTDKGAVRPAHPTGRQEQTVQPTQHKGSEYVQSYSRSGTSLRDESEKSSEIGEAQGAVHAGTSINEDDEHQQTKEYSTAKGSKLPHHAGSGKASNRSKLPSYKGSSTRTKWEQAKASSTQPQFRSQPHRERSAQRAKVHPPQPQSASRSSSSSGGTAKSYRDSANASSYAASRQKKSIHHGSKADDGNASTSVEPKEYDLFSLAAEEKMLESTLTQLDHRLDVIHSRLASGDDTLGESDGGSGGGAAKNSHGSSIGVQVPKRKVIGRRFRVSSAPVTRADKQQPFKPRPPSKLRSQSAQVVPSTAVREAITQPVTGLDDAMRAMTMANAVQPKRRQFRRYKAPSGYAEIYGK
eukprot:m.260607 g.260607  ORF g.260607 m.260607 type:complete len:596 (+) comp15564_c2_seq5:236-2023(+)